MCLAVVFIKEYLHKIPRYAEKVKSKANEIAEKTMVRTDGIVTSGGTDAVLLPGGEKRSRTSRNALFFGEKAFFFSVRACFFRDSAV